MDRSKLSAPITSLEKRAYIEIMAYKPITKYDYERLALAIHFYEMHIEKTRNNDNTNNDGLLGVIVELFSQHPFSSRTHVMREGVVDSSISIDGKRYPLEIKTNGGEMCGIFERIEKSNKLGNGAYKRNTYIRYYLNIDIKPSKYNKDGIRRLDVVMRLTDFLDLLERADAIETRATRNIKKTSKRLYNALIDAVNDNIAIPFDRRMMYVSEDFTE